MSAPTPWEALALILLAIGGLALCWRNARRPASRFVHGLSTLKGVRVALTAISQRKQTEEALRQSNETLRALIEACPLSIMALDPQGKVTLWNCAAERVFGWSAEEVLGRSNPMVPEDKKEEHRFLRERALKGIATTGVEIRRRRKDGSPIDLSVSTAPLRDARGEICGGMSVLEDITARKRSEQALCEANQKLEQYAAELQAKNEELAVALARAEEATELKSRFLANMSHEIRTPMNGVLGMSELLLGTRLDPEQQGYADAIKSSVEALLTVINDILDISKVEAGRLQTECVPFELEATVEEALGLLVIGAQAKGLDLSCCLSPGLPHRVRGDPARLRQVLMNLVGNAVKFTDRGGVSVKVELRAETAETTTICFTVQDTGIGIAPEQRPRLFDAFVQGDTSTTRRYGGTGLGLAISAHLVKLMGGEIDFQSEVGRGSTFWFTVKFQKAAEGDLALDAAPVPAAQRDQRAAGAQILLAEDNEINRRIALHILEKAGHRVKAVPNGRTAVEAMARSSFDLVLMDVQMPEMDGLEATTMIRRLEGASRHVPIIAMTASAMAGDRQRCLAAGMDDYISKPVRREQLLKTVQSWVRP